MPFELTNALGLIPALPLFSAGCAAVCGVERGSRLCAAAALSSLAAVAWCAARLYALPETDRYLLCDLAPALRVGSLEVRLALALDPLSAPLSIAASVVGSLTALSLLLGSRRGVLEKRELAGQSLLLAAAQLTLLAQGFFVMFLAWSAAWVASALLLGRPALRSSAPAAGLLLVAGAALLFWVYGGHWGEGDYTPALRPRLVAVDAAPAGGSAPIAALKPGELTLSALPGARVELGAAELCAIDADGRRGGIGLSARPCRERAESPFLRLPVPAAIHDLHVYPGPGTNELSVQKVRLGAQKETLLALLGPTLGFRELADQLTIPSLSEEHGMRRAVRASELWGFPALVLALVVLLAAAALKSDREPRAWSVPALPAPTIAALCGLATFGGSYLVARLDFLLALAPGVATLGVAYGCVAGARCAARALDESDLGRGLFRITLAHGGLAFAGVCAGAGPSAVLYLALASTAAAAFVLSARGRRLAALGLVVVPLPALGQMMHRVFVDGASHVPGAALCALLAMTYALIAHAVRRLYQRAEAKPVPATESALLRWLGAPRSARAPDAWAARSVARVGRALARVERALYAPARHETRP